MKTAASILLLLTISSCGRKEESPATVQAQQRIVSLVPSVTEIIFDIGAGDRIVGVCTSCNHPDGAKSIQRVADLNIDLEKLIAAKPDIVFTSDIRKIENERLAEARLNIVAIRENSVTDILASYAQIGAVLGCPQAADEAAIRFRRKTDALPRLSKPLRCFAEFGSNPIWTFSSGTFAGEILARVGFVNIADGKVKDWGTVDWEIVVKEDPDVIILLHSDVEGFKARTSAQSLKAVKNGKLIVVDPDLLLRPGPRLPDGALKAYESASR